MSVRTIDQISDDELESCYDGCTNNDMVRELVEECLDDEGYINVEDFGYFFARAIEGFIDAEEDSDEYVESWEANLEWGERIAENINEALAIETPEEFRED